MAARLDHVLGAWHVQHHHAEFETDRVDPTGLQCRACLSGKFWKTAITGMLTQYRKGHSRRNRFLDRFSDPIQRPYAALDF